MRLLSEITKHILTTEQAAAWDVPFGYAAAPSGCRLRSREKSFLLPGYQKQKRISPVRLLLRRTLFSLRRHNGGQGGSKSLGTYFRLIGCAAAPRRKSSRYRHVAIQSNNLYYLKVVTQTEGRLLLHRLIHTREDHHQEVAAWSSDAV
jgi:hypothetical protein